MKRLVSLTTAVLVAVAFAVPVFAASPDTSTVMSTPTTLPAAVAASKGLTAEEQALVATTPEEAVALAATTVVEATNPADATLASANAPAVIALAKADILKNATVKSALSRRGVAGRIAASQMAARADGKSQRTSLDLSTTGLVPGQRAAILYYLPGDITPRLAYPTWRNGKLRVTLPLPCMYNLVF